MTDFEGAHPALSQALTKKGYTKLTPVQEAVLAPELRDADALVSAQTGSGKTVAFGLNMAPTLLGDEQIFDKAERPLALLIAPTRELALQVKRELGWLYGSTHAQIASCVGGMDMRTERRDLQRGAHIVVGTPGRLRDHIERGSLDTSGLKVAVLDEADEMLDLGFRDDLEYILKASPRDRRTLMFSATVPKSIASLAQRYQNDAVRVKTVDEQGQHSDIDYRALTVAPNDRENAIVNVLRYYEAKNALIFCSTRATVNHMTARFANRGFSVVALSGELSQKERTNALQSLRSGRARVCVATDVAARGLDLPNLDLVVHADIPKNPEILLHRSGRTGRAGRKGVCTLIVPHNARKRTERLLNNAHVTAEWAKPPSAEEVEAKDRERIFEDPSLSEPLTDVEQVFVAELLEKHGAEQIAAAFLRQHMVEQTAPEEMIDSGPPERDRERSNKKRDDFEGGVWISLSVGRDHNAEPRWLLPTLCRAGHITKRNIGAIRVQERETYVELSPDSIDGFLEAIGPSRKMEKTITVDRLEGEPNFGGGSGDTPPRPASRPSSHSGPRKEKSYKSDKSFGDRKRAAPPPRARKVETEPDRAPRPPREQKVENEPERAPRQASGGPASGGENQNWADRNDKPKKKAGPKKPHKGKIARAEAKRPKGNPPPRSTLKLGDKEGRDGKPKGRSGDKPFGAKPRKSGVKKPRTVKAGSFNDPNRDPSKPGARPMKRRK
jgi:ATP-dependent RNA helicase DeaD